MAPAVVERAAKVGILVCDVLPDLAAEQVLTRVMNNTLDALGAERLPDINPYPTTNYRLDLLNADCDLQRLQDGLGRLGEGRLCLYGPPGTGKTAFGRHLAQALDRPLLVKRASDILSPYVGLAERNIAQMFSQARADGAVLLPVFGDPADVGAIETLARLHPDREVVAIPGLEIVKGGGGIHCITQQEPLPERRT